MRVIVSKYAVIFDALKAVRTYAKETNMEAVIQAVEHAENMAMMEICRVDLEKPSDEFDALLNAVFPNMQGAIH